MKMIPRKVAIMSSNGHVEIIPYLGAMDTEVNRETASSELVISNVRCDEDVSTSSQQIDLSKSFESFKIVEEQTCIDSIKSIGKEIKKKRQKRLRVKSRIHYCRDEKRLGMYGKQLLDLEEEIKDLEKKIRASPIFKERIWNQIVETQKKINLEYDSNIKTSSTKS